MKMYQSPVNQLPRVSADCRMRQVPSKSQNKSVACRTNVAHDVEIAGMRLWLRRLRDRSRSLSSLRGVAMSNAIHFRREAARANQASNRVGKRWPNSAARY